MGSRPGLFQRREPHRDAVGLNYPTPLKRLLLLSAAAVLVVACDFTDRRTFEQLSQEHRDLIAALEGHRLALPRFAGLTRWEPCDAIPGHDRLVPPTRCRNTLAPGDAAFGRITRVGQRIRQRKLLAPTSATRHAEAVWHLLWDRADSLDLAIRKLNSVVGDEPGRQSAWADLAAAHLLRASARDSPVDIVHALAAAERSCSAANCPCEYRFNKALALSLFALHPKATEEWRKCAEDEPSADWRREVQGRIVSIGGSVSSPEEVAERERVLWQAATGGDFDRLGRTVSSSPQLARTYGEEKLLALWAQEAGASRHSEAASVLAGALLLGRVIADTGGDQMLLGATRVIARVSAEGDSSRLSNLIAGHRQFATAREAYRTGDLRAEDGFRAAQEALSAAASPFAGWASFYVAVCRYLAQDRATAGRLLAEIRRDSGSAGHVVLEARAKWVLGLIAGLAGDQEEAIRLHEEALATFARLGEGPNEMALHSMLAEALSLVGETERAWAHRYRALRLIPGSFDAVRAHNALYDAAEATLRLGRHQAALYLHDALVRVGVGQPNGLLTAEAFVRRAQNRTLVGDVDAALADLEAARSHVEALEAGGLKRRFLADIASAAAEARRERDPARAGELLTEAQLAYEAIGYRRALPRLLQTRSAIETQLGQYRAAERSLLTGIREYEDQRRRLSLAGQRVAYFDQADELFERMIALQAGSLERPLAALEFAERFRSQELLTTLSGRLGLPTIATPIDRLRQDLAADTALVYYQYAGDELHLWVISNDAVSHRVLPGSRVEVESTVRLMDSPPSGGWIAVAARLYDLLVRPVADHLESARHLVIVPDRRLYAVPFVALFDDARGRFLVERWDVSIAPSAAVFHLARLGAQRLPGPPQRALLIGDPDPAAMATMGLPPLPGTAQEIHAIRRLYPRAQALLGPEATRSRLEAALEHADVVHFATHARINEHAPDYSLIALSLEGERPATARLRARDIDGLPLLGRRLIILAACGTASGRLSPSEGVMGLAAPFLAAGVPGVVATLWPVDDQVTSTLVVSFHRELAAGTSPREALRQAQLEELTRAEHDTSRPPAWAAFQLLGT